MVEYLRLALLGKNEWWRFVIAILVILIAWQLIGAIPSIFLILWIFVDGDPLTQVTSDGQFLGIDINVSFTAMLLASVAFLGGLFLAMRYVHQRGLLSLVTPAKNIDGHRVLQGFICWFVLCVVIGVIETLLHPGRYIYSLDVQKFLPFVFLAVILIPIQTTTEELFFRGYLLQGFGLSVKNPFLLSFLSGLIFMLPHLLNPETKLNYLLMGFSYFMIGAVLAFITLRDGRLELALGMHAANNLYTAIFANAIVTVMPTPSLFLVKELDVVYSTIATFFASVIFVLLIIGPLRRGRIQESV